MLLFKVNVNSWLSYMKGECRDKVQGLKHIFRQFLLEGIHSVGCSHEQWHNHFCPKWRQEGRDLERKVKTLAYFASSTVGQRWPKVCKNTGLLLLKRDRNGWTQSFRSERRDRVWLFDNSTGSSDKTYCLHTPCHALWIWLRYSVMALLYVLTLNSDLGKLDNILLHCTWAGEEAYFSLTKQHVLPSVLPVSLLKNLKHANIVTLHDIIHTDRCLTLVFEYLVSTFSMQVFSMQVFSRYWSQLQKCNPGKFQWMNTVADCSCYVFQDSDLKQYLDNCGNLMSMHNVKVSHM